MYGRMIVSLLALAAVLMLYLAGCSGGNSNPTISLGGPGLTYTPTPSPGTLIVTSSINDSHTHDITIPAADLANPPAAGAIYTSTLVSGHTHTTTLSQQQLQSVNNDESVTIISSTDLNPITNINHSHNWVIRSGFTSTSTLSNAHTHDVTVLYSDLSTLPAAGVTYTSTLVANHTHTVTLTQQQLSSIDSGGTVTVTSSLQDSHTHDWTFTKP